MAISSSSRNTDVYELAITGTAEQMREAVSRGANFNVKRFSAAAADEYSVHFYEETPLHRAAAYNRNAESIRFLISQELDINAFASEGGTVGFGGTPLMYAVLYDNPGMVNLLLDVGANPNIRSPEGKKAWDYAEELPSDTRLRSWKAFSRLRDASL